MSTTIDNRVVKLIFDSDQFQRGIKKTQDALKNFEQALKLDKASEGLDKLKEATEKINVKALSDKFKKETDAIKSSTKEASNNIESISKSADKVNLDGVGKAAKKASKDVESAAKDASDSIEKIDDTASNVDFSDISKAANDTVSKVNNAADGTDFSPMTKSADAAADGVNEAARSIDLAPVVSEIQEANRGFNAMQEIAIGALRRIGGEGVDFVTNKLKSLANAAIKPVIDGFGEYEQQMGSIQTILANTTGGFDNAADIQNVNDKLYELNKYADETIYSFSDMTAAIGRFTAAGIGKENLQEAVDAVKGVSGVAALQGSTRSDVHRVLPQIAQALSAGQVTLQDWRSIETASMGGKSFVDALADMAIHMASTGQASGTAKMLGEKLINGEISMREALNQQDYGVWLSSDILANTFRSFAIDSRDKKSVEENLNWLKSIGYSMDEALDIIKRSDLARRSAQEVRTFTQLKDTMAEGLGSNWAQIWQNFIGDFKQATDTFTYLSDFLGKRIDGFFSGIVNISEHFKKSGAIELIFGSIVRDENGKPIINEVTNEIERVGGALDNVLHAIFKPLDAIGQAFKEVFAPIFEQSDKFIALDGMLIGLATAIRDATASLVISDDAAEAVKSFWVGLFQVLKLVLKLVASVVSAVAWAVGNIRKVLDPLLDIVFSIVGVIGKAVGWLAEKIGEVVNAIQVALKPVADAISAVFDVVGGILQRLDLDDKIAGLGDLIIDVLEGIWRFVDIPNIIMGIGDALGHIFHFIGDITGWNAAVEEADLIMNEFGEEVSVVDVWFARLLDNPVIAFFKGIVDAIGWVIKGIGGVISAIFGLNKEGEGLTLGKIFRDLANIIMTVVLAPFKLLSTVVFGLAAIIYKAGSALVNFFGLGDKIKAIGGTIVNIATSIGEGIKTAWDTISGFFQGIYDAFVTGGIAGVQAKVEEYQNKITETFKNLWNTITESNFGKGVKAVFDGIRDAVTKAGGALSEFWESAKEIFSAIGGFVTNVFGGVIERIQSFFSGITQFVSALWMISDSVPQFLYYLAYYGIGAVISAVKWGLFTILVNVVKFIRDLPAKFESLKSALIEKFNAIKEFFLHNPVVDAIKTVFFGVTETVDNAAGTVRSAFDKVAEAPTALERFKWYLINVMYGIKETIKQRVEDFKTFLLNTPIAKAIIDWYAGVSEASGDQTTIWGKLANSFKDMQAIFEGFKQWASGVGQSIVDFVKPIWDSTRTIPEFISKLFEQIGLAIVSGVQELRERIARIGGEIAYRINEVRYNVGKTLRAIPSKLKEFKDAFIERARDIATGIHDSVSSFADKVKTSIGFAAQVVGGAVDNTISGIGKKAGAVKEAIKSSFGAVIGWIREKGGSLFEKGKEIFKKVKEWFSVANIVDTLFGKIKSVLEKINDWLKGKSESVSENTKNFMQKVDESIVKPFEEIKKTLGQIKQNSIIGVLEEKFRNELDALANFINGIPAMMQELFTKVDSPAFDRLITLLNTLFGGKLTLSIASVFTRISKVIKGFSKVGKGFNNLGGTISKSIELNSNKVGNAFTSMSKVLSGSATELFKNFGDLQKLAEKKAKNENRKIFSEAVRNIAISMAIVGAAIAVISLVPDPTKASLIMLGVGAMLIVMQWLSSLLTKHYKKHKGGTELIKAAGSLGVFAISLLLMMRTIKKLTEFDFEGNKKGLIAAGVMLVALGGITALTTRLGGKGGKYFINAAVGMTILIWSLGSFLKAIKKLDEFISGMDLSDSKSLEDRIYAIRQLVASTALAMVGIAAAMKIADSKTALSTGMAFYVMARAIKKIAETLVELSGTEEIHIGKLIASMIGIAVFIGEFIALCAMTSKVSAKDISKIGSSFIRYALAIRIIASAIKTTTKEKVDSQKLTDTIWGLGILIGEFVGLCYIVGNAKNLDAKMMQRISISFIAYGAAVLIISKAISSLMGAITDINTFGVVAGTLVAMAGLLALIIDRFRGFKTGAILAITTTIGVYAVAIGLIAEAITKVAKNHFEKLDIATIAGAIGGLMTILVVLTNSFADKTKSTTNRSSMSAGKIVAMTAAIGVYAVAIGVIAEAITKVGKNHFEKLDIATIAGAIGGLMSILALLAKEFSNETKKGKVTITNTSKIVAMTAAIGVYSLAIGVIAEAITKVAKNHFEKLDIATIAGSIGGLVLLFGVIAKMVAKVDFKQIIGTAAGLGVYAMAITILSNSLIEVAKVKVDTAQLGATTLAIGSMVLLFGGLVKLLQRVSMKDLLSISGALIAYSLAIAVIGNALTQIASLDIDGGALAASTAAIAGLVAVYWALNKFLSVNVVDILSLSGALLVYSFAITVISNALVNLVSQVSDGGLLMTAAGSIAALVGVFGLMAGLIKNGVSAIAIAAAVALYGVSITILANALGSLAQYKAEEIQGIALAIGALVGVFALAGLVGQSVAVGMALFAGGLALVSAALLFLGFVIKQFPDYERVREFGRSIIGGLIGGLVDGITDVVKAIYNLCNTILAPILSFFGIHSPSRLMHDKVGLMITEGLAGGLDEGKKDVNKSVDGMMDDMSDRIDGGMPDMTVDLTPEMSQNEKSLLGMYDYDIPERYETPEYETYTPEDEESFDSLDALKDKTDALSSLDFGNVTDQFESLNNVDLSNVTGQVGELGDLGASVDLSNLTEGMSELDGTGSGLGDTMEGLGEDFGGLGDSMDGLGQDFGGLSDSIGGSGDALSGFNDQLGDLSGTMDEMGGLDGIADFGQSIPETIGEGMDGSDWNVGDAISKLFGGGEDGEEPDLSSAEEKATGIGGKLSGWLGEGFMSGDFNLGTAIKELVFGKEGEEGEDSGGIFGKVKKTLGEIPQKLGNWFGTDVLPTLGSWKDGFWTWVEQEGLPALGDFIMKIPQKLGELGAALSKWYEEHGKPILEKAKQMLGDWWTNTAAPALTKFFTETVPAKLGELKDAIGGWINEKIDLLKTTIGNKFNEVKDNIAKWFDSTGIPEIGKKLEELAGSVGKFFTDLPGTIGGFFEKIKTDLLDIGGNIVQGIIDGFTQNDVLNWLNEKITNLGDWILEHFRTFFGINSPSKLMRDTIGLGIDEGIGEGIVMYSGICTKTAEQVGIETVDAFEKELSGITEVDSEPTITPVIDVSSIKKNLAATSDTMSAIPLNAQTDLNQNVESTLILNGVIQAINDHRTATIQRFTTLGEGVTGALARQTDEQRSTTQDTMLALNTIAEKVDRVDQYFTSMFKDMPPSEVAEALNTIVGYSEITAINAANIGERESNVYMDTGALVGAIAPEMDRALGYREVGASRGY